MINRIVLVSLLAASLLFGASFDASSASAQDIQITGPLAGASAVRRLRIYRQGRFELQPFVAFTLQDEFSRTIFTGAQLSFHLTDWLGIGVWGAFGAVHIDTSLTDQIALRGQTTDRNRLSLPNRANFPDQIGTLSWVAAPQVTFIPLRGKLSLFQSLFVDTDFYLVGGVAFVGVEERADTDQNACTSPAACEATQSVRATRVAIAPTFGAGLNLYINDFLSLTFEWRGMPFAWNTSGTDESGGPGPGDFPGGANASDQPERFGRIDSEDYIFHFNHMVMIGFGIFLPTDVTIGD